MKKPIRIRDKITHGFEILGKAPDEIYQGVLWRKKYKFLDAYRAIKSSDALHYFMNDDKFKEERSDMVNQGYSFKVIKLY